MKIELQTSEVDIMIKALRALHDSAGTPPRIATEAGELYFKLLRADLNGAEDDEAAEVIECREACSAPTLRKVGEFLTCESEAVEYFREQGYKVDRDGQLGINLVSPPAYCMHGMAFHVQCDLCAADVHNMQP